VLVRRVQLLRRNATRLLAGLVRRRRRAQGGDTIVKEGEASRETMNRGKASEGMVMDSSFRPFEDSRMAVDEPPMIDEAALENESEFNEEQKDARLRHKAREWDVEDTKMEFAPSDGDEKEERNNAHQRSVVKAATVGLVECYKRCSDDFRYAKSLNPRRALTKNCKPSKNNGFDNSDNDLILIVNDHLVTQGGISYRVVDMLGQGSFGQVAKCKVVDRKSGRDSKRQEMVAVKVIKNKPAYCNQALVETKILRMLNNEEERSGSERRIVKLLECFTFKGHLCLVFTMLSMNLYEMIKQNRFRGLPLDFIRSCICQINEALQVLAEIDVVHCDLKPENILLTDSSGVRVQLIDFGSSCFSNQTVYTYIQSRFYRAPEVILGLPYDSAIDMWSLGCVAAELYMGLPIFPGVSEHNQLARICETVGNVSPEMLEKAKDISKFYRKRRRRDPTTGSSFNVWELKSAARWARDNGLAKPEKTKRYVKQITLEDMVHQGTNRDKVDRTEDIKPEMLDALRDSFLDLLRGLLQLNPQSRWSAWQTRSHPFLAKGNFQSQRVAKSSSFSKPAPIPKSRKMEFSSSVESNLVSPTDSSNARTEVVGSIGSAAPAEDFISGTVNPANQDPQDAYAFMRSDSFSSTTSMNPSIYSFGDSSRTHRAGSTVSQGSSGSFPPGFLMSPLNRPSHPYPIAHHSSWDFHNVNFAAGSPGGPPMGSLQMQRYSSCPANFNGRWFPQQPGLQAANAGTMNPAPFLQGHIRRHSQISGQSFFSTAGSFYGAQNFNFIPSAIQQARMYRSRSLSSTTEENTNRVQQTNNNDDDATLFKLSPELRE